MTLHDPKPTPNTTTDDQTSTLPTHTSSLLRRLSTSIPENTTHVLERLFSPNTMMYSMPHNDPHGPHKSTPASPTVKKERRFSFGGRREKHVKVVEVELAPEEQKMCGEKQKKGEDGKDAGFGVALCREAEIEKWKVDVKEGRRRRGSWH